jgi:cell division protease FtsH
MKQKLPENFPKKQIPKKSTPQKQFFWAVVYLFILLMLFFPYLPGITNSVKEISWQQFENEIISRNAVEKINILNKEDVEIFIKPDMANNHYFKDVFESGIGRKINPGPHYRFSIGSIETFERRLDEAQKNKPVAQKIPVTYSNTSNWFWNILGWILPVFLIFYLWRVMFRRYAGMGSASGANSAFNFGKSNAVMVEREESRITFEDVAGLEEAEMEVKEIVNFLKNPKLFTRLGAKIPKGILLIGPPGTGKTLLAKAVAGEARVPFFIISGSEFVEMFVGVGAARVRDLFKQAKEKVPCIVFIDELDAIGRSRGKGAYLSGANDERESTLNQLLTEMDGFGSNSGVIVLAATNRADMLDPALLRPGRFDRHIYLELPNLKEREVIFNVHLRPLVLDGTIDVHFLASQTPGSSGADIANICNEAALIAARGKKDGVGKVDFMDAIDRIVAGLEKKSKIISTEEKRIIAFHEAGHALVSSLLKHVDSIVKVSIIPRGKTLGASWYLPEEKQLRNKTAFIEHLCSGLAGRAAEEIIFGDISTGALDDLEKVTKEAYTMVVYYGFNKKIGNVSFYDSSGQRDMGIQKPFSEETGRMIDEEVRILVSSCYERSKKILETNKESLGKIADLLFKKEVIYREDLDRILGKKTIKNDLNPLTPLRRISQDKKLKKKVIA